MHWPHLQDKEKTSLMLLLILPLWNFINRRFRITFIERAVPATIFIALSMVKALRSDICLRR
jgi:hypothetical protein